LTGSMRLAQEARERAQKMTRQSEIAAKKRKLDRKRAALEAQIAALRAEFEAEEVETGRVLARENQLVKQLEMDEVAMARSRRADKSVIPRNGI
jgi:circadian clock protein KaiC